VHSSQQGKTKNNGISQGMSPTRLLMRYWGN
jgi:hypothetical protein